MSCSALAGCTATDSGPGAWLLSPSALFLGALFLGAMFFGALLLVAFGFHALGRLRAQSQTASNLRALRQELRLRRELDTAVTWRSDAQHRLLQWQAPGQAEALPDADTAAQLSASLQPQLQAGRSFQAHELRLATTAAGTGGAFPGSRWPGGAAQGWRVSGSVCQDDLGAFAGFLGRAEVVDVDQPLQLAAASLETVLATCGVTALAYDLGPGYVLQHLSPAAMAAWPAARPGLLLSACTAGLPEPLAASLNDIALQPAGTTLDVAGWRLRRFDAAPGVAGLWLGQAKAESPAPAGGSEAEQFSMTVSHDLRAPIRVVEGFTRIVKEDYGHLLDRVGNDHLDRVLGAAARMNLMIDALLTLARLSTQPLARQPVNLSQLASFVIDDLQRHAPDRLVDVEIEPGLAAQGDPTLLRLVLENLLGNAWKYTGRCARAHIVLRVMHDGGRRIFEVRDNGAGFDMRSSDRLFGLFQRLHSANDFPGHGVGLASVRRIVQRHGGSIWAEAEPGRGATFHFTLAP